MHRTARLALLGIAVSILTTTATYAQDPGAAPPLAAPEPPAQPPPYRGPFALGAQLGMFTGTGVTLQVGVPAVGLRVGAGWAPVLLAMTQRAASSTGEEKPKFEFYSALLVAPDLYLRVMTTPRGTAIGLQAGYRYSSLFGSGGAGGVYVQHPLGRRLDLLLGGGLMVFPDGQTRLEEKKGLKDVDFGFPGPNVNLALTVGLLLFP